MVEDHIVTRETLTRLLQNRGYTVLVAGKVREALQILSEVQTVDFLLCDIGLPDGSGLDIMRKLKAAGGVQRVSGIAFSGFGTDADLVASQEAGFVRHLIKPLAVAALVRAIEEVRLSASQDTCTG